MKRTRGIIKILAAALIFAVGFGVLFYPVFSDLWNQNRQNQLIHSYEEKAQQLSQADYSAWLETARAYNDALSPSFGDAFKGRQPEEDDPYWSLLDLEGTGVMGYLEIPRLGLRLPIYHGTGESALQQGIGHLAGTSLPIGGTGYHTVLSGHRGLPSAHLFTDLDQMEIGDRFYLCILGRRLAYETDRITVVEPDQVEELLPVEGEDLATLVTCTPYGVNTHRLLVRGRRVEETPQEEAPQVTVVQQVTHSLGWKGWLLAGVLAAFLLGLLVLLIVRLARRKKRG